MDGAVVIPCDHGADGWGGAAGGYDFADAAEVVGGGLVEVEHWCARGGERVVVLESAKVMCACLGAVAVTAAVGDGGGPEGLGRAADAAFLHHVVAFPDEELAGIDVSQCGGCGVGGMAILFDAAVTVIVIPSVGGVRGGNGNGFQAVLGVPCKAAGSHASGFVKSHVAVGIVFKRADVGGGGTTPIR